MHPARRHPRRRGVQVDRRRQDVDPPGPAGHASHIPCPDTPAEPRHRLRGGAGTRLRSQPGARHLPLRRRREELGACPLQEPGRGRGRPVHRPEQPAHSVRRDLAGPPQLLEHVERRPGQWPVEVDRRRRHLDRHHRQARLAQGAQGPHRRGRLPGQGRTCLCDGRGRGVRPVQVRRRRRHVGAGQRRPRPPGPALVLPARLRRPAGRRHRLDPKLPVPQVRRRRQDLRPGHHAARRQPRPLDRPAQYAAHDRGQRRWRLRIAKRRRHLVDHLQPAHVPVLPRGGRRSVPLQGVWDPAGQLRHQRALPDPQGRHPVGRLLHGRQLRERLHRDPPRGPQRRRLRRHRQLPRRRGQPAAIRPQHRPGKDRHRVARDQHGLRRQGHEVPVPVDLPDSVLAPRPQRPLRHGKPCLPLDRPGQQLGGDQPRPDPQRRHQAGGLRRTGNQGHLGGRDLCDHIRVRRVAP